MAPVYLRLHEQVTNQIRNLERMTRSTNMNDQRLRLAFLSNLNAMSDGNTGKPVKGAMLAEAVGIIDDEEKLRSVSRYLENEKLVKVDWLKGIPAFITLTHAGLREVEDATRQPDQPTRHFMAVNILNVENMNNSPVQQGNIDSTQTVALSPEAINQLQDFIERLSNCLKDFQSSETANMKAEAEASTLRAQVASPKPNPSIIKEGLLSLRTILEGATANVLASKFLAEINELVARF